MLTISEGFGLRLVMLASLAAALIPFHFSGVALADDATVSLCTDAGLRTAIDAVEASGGGLVTFDCVGTINVSSGFAITTDVQIVGNGDVILDAGGDGRFFSVQTGATLTLLNLTLQNGSTQADGGAISNKGSLHIEDSTFLNNRSRDKGGAIGATFSENVTVVRSTFIGNRSLDGGAIYFPWGGYTLLISASTFFDNRADELSLKERSGGAIYVAGGTATIESSTIVGNLARSSGGGIRIGGNTTTTIVSSIVANNVTNGLGTDVNCADFSGRLVSGGYNLSDDDSCGFTSAGDFQNSAAINVADPADNGGATQTMALEAGSGALDAALCSLASATDQRGAPRPASGTNCDIGALESAATVPTRMIAAYQSAGPSDEVANASVHSVATGPIGATYNHNVDCDNDGSYETASSGSSALGRADCFFDDNGSYTVGVQVCNAANNTDCDTADATITVLNVVPTIDTLTADDTVDEGSPVTLSVSASDIAGANDPLTYSFDCDDDGSYETAGDGNVGQCVLPDNGVFTVGVLVEDDDGGSTAASIDVEGRNVPPVVNTPITSPAPSNEGEAVTASATFSDPGVDDTHTCTVDYGGGSDPVDGIVVDNVCTGPSHIYTDDDPSGSSSDSYPVTIIVTDDDDGSGQSTGIQVINNVAPVIDGITTNGPVAQGESAVISVEASDVGVDDVLTYEFDCDHDGSYETAGVGSQGECALDPAEATPIIGVQVTDDDLGVVTGEVQIVQTLTLCFNPSTREISNTNRSDSCGTGKMPLVLSAATPTTLCIGIYDRSLSWSPGGTCTTGKIAHAVPTSGLLAYCANPWTGSLRAPYRASTCSANERPGVIPG